MSVDVQTIAQERLTTIKTKLASLRAIKQAFERLLASYSTLRDPENLDEWISAAYRLAQENGKSKTQAMLDAVQVILTTANAPMPPRLIVKRLNAANIPVTGDAVNRPSRWLYRRLRYAKPRFDNSSGKGWEIPNITGTGLEVPPKTDE